MNYFYQDRYNFYYQNYWFERHDSLFKPNGFVVYPNTEYNYFVTIINDLNNKTTCSVMDICCGNGLLLKHLMKHCYFQIVPFGIDFIEESIKQAKEILHQNFSNNFFVSNAIDFNFSNLYIDFVLIDPYHFTDKDLIKLLGVLIKQTSKCIVFYTYADILRLSKLKSVTDFPVLMELSNLNTFNYKEISIAIMYCKKE